MKIYAISGLGADKRVFQYLRLEHELIPIDWIEPLENEHIENYALRLAKAINTKEKFAILGVSFGGLIAVEISKILKPVLTVLISSVETKNDLRFLYRIIGKTRLINLIPIKLFDIPRSIASFLFGTKQKELLNAILDDTDLKFTKWAVQQLCTWQNEQHLENCLKINGTKDKLIPFSKSGEVKLIKGGGHFMVVDKAEEISYLINQTVSHKATF